MAQIDFVWECPACLFGNKTKIEKPTFTTASFFTSTCGYCKSKASVKVNMAKGRPGQLQYYFTDLELSRYGHDKAEKRLNEQNQTTPEKSDNERKPQ